MNEWGWHNYAAGSLTLSRRGVPQSFTLFPDIEYAAGIDGDVNELRDYLNALEARATAAEAERDRLGEVARVARDFVAIHEAILGQGAHAPGSPQQITHWATHDLLKQTMGLPVERDPTLALEALWKIVGGNIAKEQGQVIADVKAKLAAAEARLQVAVDDAAKWQQMLLASLPVIADKRWYAEVKAALPDNGDALDAARDGTAPNGGGL